METVVISQNLWAVLCGQPTPNHNPNTKTNHTPINEFEALGIEVKAAIHPECEGQGRCLRRGLGKHADNSRYVGQYKDKTGKTWCLYQTDSPRLLHDTVAKIKKTLGDAGKTVSLQPVEEMAGKRLFIAGDAKSAFAITSDGDLESVASMAKLGRFDDLMDAAIKAGADRGDAYAIPNRNGDGYFLPSLYAKHGLVEVARVAINPDYDDSNGEAHHVSVMAKLPNPPRKIKEYDKDGYDAALKYRDSLLEKNK